MLCDYDFYWLFSFTVKLVDKYRDSACQLASEIPKHYCY